MRTGRLILGVSAALIAGMASIPLVIASVTEDRFERIRDAAVEQSPMIQSWSIDRYDRGYLGAEAITRMTVGAPDSGEPFVLELEHRIRHAPTSGTDLATVHTRPVMDNGPIRDLAQVLYGETRPPFTVDVRIGFTGARTVHARSPATDGMRRTDNARIDWHGLEAMLSIGADERDLAYHLEAPGLDLASADGDAGVRVESLRADGSYAATEFERVWTGGASGRIDRIAFEGPDGNAFTLSDLAFSDEARLDDGLFGFTVEASADAVETPRYALSSVRMAITGERLAPALLQALQRSIERASGNGDKATDAGAIASGLEQAPWAEIANEEPVLRISRFRADTANGPLSLTARAGLHAPGEGREAIAAGALMGLAHGEIDARAPRALVVDTIARSIALRADTDPAAARESALSTLDSLIAQGLVTSGNGGVASSASYDRGRIRINGRSLFGG